MTLIQYYHIAFETWAVIFCLIAAIVIFAKRVFDPKGAWSLICMLLSDAALNVSEILAYTYRGDLSEAGYYIVRISNFLVFFFGFLLAVFAAVHIERTVEVRGGKKERYLTNLTCGISLTGIMVLILSRFFGLIYAFDANNCYYRLDDFWIMTVIGELAVIPIIVRVIRNRHVFKKPDYVAFLCFALFPFVGYVIQYFFYGISLYNIANSISIIIIVLAHELVYAAENVNRERRRIDERIRLYNGQIQPHFVFNSLTAIRASLDDPKKAEEILNHFIAFLRGSMDVLTETECISAERELNTVENYLYMEKVRFGDNLNIKYEIEDVDFFLPAFTIQTLVENGVNHGIRKKKSGCGTVEIKSYETPKAHIIEVRDDGVGITEEDYNRIKKSDPSLEVSPLLDEEEQRNGFINDKDDDPHIGLWNIKKRLYLMCNGRLEVTGSPGEGALAKVIIPKVNKRKNVRSRV